MKRWLAALAISCLSITASAYDTKVTVVGHDLPAELQGVGVDEHLGQFVNLDLQFTDDKNQPVKLGDYFNHGKPVLMAIVYYTCPSLCNYHLNGITDTLKQLKWTTGKDFELVAISMNTAEKADVAGPKKANYLKSYGRSDGENGWHFLVGSTENVSEFAKEVGFKYKWMEDKKQFAHVSVAYVLTPEGKISRYLHGIQIAPQTMKMSLLEASNGKIGTMLDQAVMFCFQFDPQKNKYTIYAWNIMRIGAALMVLLMALVLIPVWMRNRTQEPRA